MAHLVPNKNCINSKYSFFKKKKLGKWEKEWYLLFWKRLEASSLILRKGRKLPTLYLLLKIILEVLASARGEKIQAWILERKSKHIIFIWYFIYIYIYLYGKPSILTELLVQIARIKFHNGGNIIIVIFTLKKAP